MIGCEPGGTGPELGRHAASVSYGRPAILHGFRCYALMNGTDAAVTSSIAAGLDYPGIGPEHSFYHATGRAEYIPITDQEAFAAFCTLSKRRGLYRLLKAPMPLPARCGWHPLWLRTK